MPTLVPPEDKPLPGTNKDVFVFDRHVVAGVYYDPRLTPPEETLFNSGIIFYDYMDVSEKFSRTSQELINNGKLKIKSRTNEFKHFEQEAAMNIPTDVIFETDRYEKMFAAWSRYLIKEKSIPETKIMPSIERYAIRNDNTKTLYKTILKFGVPGDPFSFFNLATGQFAVNMILGAMFPGRPSVDGLSNIDKILLNHPLGHFPPIKPGSNYLDQVVFFDPEFSQISMLKLVSQYGQQHGMMIYQAMISHGKKVLYSDIITGKHGIFGYNISVDFRSFGIPYFYVIDYDMWKLYDLSAYNKMFPWESGSQNVNGQIYNVRMREFTGRMNTQEKRLQIIFSDQRDLWIQLFLLGGVIPLQQSTINQSYVKSFYPIYFKEIKEDFMKAIAIKLVGLIITAVITYYTGGATAGVVTALAQVIVPKIIEKLNIPFAKEEMQMVMSLVFSAALNKFSTETDQSKKATLAMNFLINSIESNIQSDIQQQMTFSEFHRALTHYDDVVLPRQQMLIELIGRSKSIRYGEFIDGTVNTGVNALSIASKELTKSRPSFQIVQGMRIAEDLSKESKLGDIMKFGALGLAGFALYKMLKK